MTNDKILPLEKKVLRHSKTVRIIHWLTVLSIFLLIFSGIGEMPVYKRYMVDQLPGLAWATNFAINLRIHYGAAFLLLFVSFFHLMYHGMRKDFGLIPRKGDFKESIQIIKAMFGFGEEPASDKYVAEQRYVYVYIAFWIGVIDITGILKALKNQNGIEFSPLMNTINTNLHTAGMVFLIFGIVGHLAAFIIKANRPLLPSMFTGKVDLEYVQHRHGIWYARMAKAKSVLRKDVQEVNSNSSGRNLKM